MRAAAGSVVISTALEVSSQKAAMARTSNASAMAPVRQRAAGLADSAPRGAGLPPGVRPAGARAARDALLRRQRVVVNAAKAQAEVQGAVRQRATNARAANANLVAVPEPPRACDRDVAQEHRRARPGQLEERPAIEHVDERIGHAGDGTRQAQGCRGSGADAQGQIGLADRPDAGGITDGDRQTQMGSSQRTLMGGWLPSALIRTLRRTSRYPSRVPTIT